jgi:hypothetical protein
VQAFDPESSRFRQASDAGRRRSCLALLLSLVAAAAILVGSGEQASAIDLDEGIYRNAALGIRMPIPPRWKLYRMSGYPSLLAILVHDDGTATLSLSVTLSRPGEKLAALVAEERRGLGAVGIEVESDQAKVLLGKKVIEVVGRQRATGKKLTLLYHQQGIQILILTLCDPLAGSGGHARDLQEILAYLTVEEQNTEGTGGAGRTEPQEIQTRPSEKEGSPDAAPASMPSRTKGPPIDTDIPDDLPEL